MTPWNLIIAKLFGSTYKDVLEASDKLRRWTIDPSKHMQSDLHNPAILVQRVNETSKSDMPESSILAIIYEALSRDPREELRMIKIILMEALGSLLRTSYIIANIEDSGISDFEVSFTL